MKINVYMKPRLAGIGAARNPLQNTNVDIDGLMPSSCHDVFYCTSVVIIENTLRPIGVQK